MQHLIITPKNKISVFDFDNSPEEIGYSRRNSSKISHFLQHISLSMQLHRLEREELSSTIFGTKIKYGKLLTKQKLAKYFKNPPFPFIEKLKIDVFCKFLVQPDKKVKKTKREFTASVAKIIEKLEKLLPL